jgi:hypothetical protein
VNAWHLYLPESEHDDHSACDIPSGSPAQRTKERQELFEIYTRWSTESRHVFIDPW